MVNAAMGQPRTPQRPQLVRRRGLAQIAVGVAEGSELRSDCQIVEPGQILGD
jgi:hypothetical protein